ncbi:phosphotransferase [Streptomyces sp. MJP52]|uniref:phosphotransferase family protein n=1 Tax=Streptomyces sp. MJP52 TaxID=2940555 RepID=UPI0024732405|nr:phosphotransferase [Streptomyces sp. MJP52]MDH6223415.1 aminoglycoside phosphotransferase (APT) family kinase protein [Streptomyces sp. MJP52]
MIEPVGDECLRARLVAALEDAGFGWEQVAGCRRLGGGTFSDVYGVRTAEGARAVVKLAPATGSPVLRYERGILGTEAWYLRTVRERTSVPVPTVLAVSAGDEGGPGDHLVTSECPGVPWEELARSVGAEARAALREELGGHMARVHAVTGTEGFGYPALPFGPLRSGWREAFLEMVDSVLDDAGRFGVTLPRPAGEIRDVIAAESSSLDEVTTPRLVHWDLWDGNILAERRPDGPRITALIDAERALWGDPVAELVSLALFHDITRDEPFLRGYRAAGGSVSFDASARNRMALYRAYLYLIMWVEARPRRFGAAQLAWLERDVFEPLGVMLDAWARGEGPVAHWWPRG